jgi:ElaB/YqjD/DUF883 family membrane-anchored ribosome-binding protein
MHATHSSELAAADPGSSSMEHAIDATQRVANQALDGLAGSVQSLRRDTVPALSRAASEASAMAERSLQALRQRSREIQKQARRASDSTADTIRREPIKSVLIAAAAGATLMAFLAMWRRSQ